ncbi:hypothetical protein BRDID11002_30810 [Bradyrhizobium diazoefficiens]
MSDYVSSLVMPDFLGHLGKVAPKARVHTVPNTILEIADQLEDNRVDCVMSVYVNEAQQPAAIRSRSLWTVDYACFMRRGHPLAGMKRLSTRTFLNAGPRRCEPRGQDHAVLRPLPRLARAVTQPGRDRQSLQRRLRGSCASPT